ncbi:MAG: ATP-dependent DNA helicase [Desulfobacteraceae bacterium]
MPPSPDSIERVFEPNGLLSSHLKGFEFRESQLAMARLIDQGLGEKRHVIIEAGTGTGKTLGYLVPIVLSGKKAVISTGTKNLQEQIFFKDIPLLSGATGLSIDAALMKGRKNYLCLHRYHQARSTTGLFEGRERSRWERVDRWIEETEFADRSELDWLADEDPFWDQVSSTSDQCLGARCLYFDDCFLNALRRRAARSRVIIVNHHLFFADLMVKQGGFGEIIPRFQVVVLDEAHNVEETATTYFGERVSSNQLFDLVSDTEKALRAAGEEEGIDRKVLEQGLTGIRAAAERLRTQCSKGDERGLLSPEARSTLKEEAAALLRQEVERIRDRGGLDDAEDSVLRTFPQRAAALVQSLEAVLDSDDPGWLAWYERRKKGVVLHASPLDVSGPLQEHLYKNLDTLTMTSATLSTNGDFTYIRSRLGLEDDVLEGIYASHFDFEHQTRMYVPRDLPLPGRAEFADRAADRILEILRITEGRALILFTSYHNLHRVHQRLASELPFSLFCQGESPRSVLLERFTRDVHSVLLATGSFWQGVDVPGEALSCLIVDKLPFDSPGDPLVAARIEMVRTKGGNPFMDYQLPSAIIALKQGLGRLIRSTADRGILAVLDARMVTSRYGTQFFRSLPAMPVGHELTELERFFEHESVVVAHRDSS